MKPYTNNSNMYGCQTAILIILRMISLCKCSDKLTQLEPLLGVKVVQSNENTNLEVVRPDKHREYPGSNSLAAKEIKNEWDKYYLCLTNDYQNEKGRKPIILQIMEGQFTSMKCSHCPRPFEENFDLEWRYKPLSCDVDDPDEPELLDLPHRMRLTHKFTLNVYNAIREFSGLYVCYHGKSPRSVYILEVVHNQRMELVPNPPMEHEPILIAYSKPLEYYYYWNKWTECSACDEIGKKFRYGTCMIKTQEVDYMYMSQNPVSFKGRVKRGFKDQLKKLKKSKPKVVLAADAKEVENARKMLSKFHNGIPCTSKLLPRAFAPIVAKHLKVETAVLIEYCKVPCTQSTIFELLDKDGNVIEIANNSAGIYSSFQHIPKAPPEIERQTLVANFGEAITIQCPGGLKHDTPVNWKIEKQWLVPELVAAESQGRITIDLVNRLHILHLRQKDSHIYSCWERDRLAGTVTLKVQKELFNIHSHHVLLIIMLIVAVNLIFIISKIIKREIKMRRKPTT